MRAACIILAALVMVVAATHENVEEELLQPEAQNKRNPALYTQVTELYDTMLQEVKTKHSSANIAANKMKTNDVKIKTAQSAQEPSIGTWDAVLTQAVGAIAKGGSSKIHKKIKKMQKIQSELTAIKSKGVNHSTKLNNTIKNKKSALTKLLDEIIRTLKNQYGYHKKDAQKLIGKIDTAVKTISKVEFGRVASKAHAWCGKWKKQQKAKQVRATKLQHRTTAQDKTVTVKLNDASPLNCPYTNSRGKPFTPKRTICPSARFVASAAFKRLWEDARSNFLSKDKAYYLADKAHTHNVTSSNGAATLFKGSIDDLAAAKKKECKIDDQSAVQSAVGAFNTANAKRASVCRSMEVIRCHVKNMEISKANKDRANSALKRCIRKVGTENHFQRTHFADLGMPSFACPTKAKYKTLIKKKHGLNLHFTGSPRAAATKSDGTVVTNQGWYPRTKECNDVKKKANTGGGARSTELMQNHPSRARSTYWNEARRAPNRKTVGWQFSSRGRVIWKNGKQVKAIINPGALFVGCTKCKQSIKKEMTMRFKSEYMYGDRAGSSCTRSHYGLPAAVYHWQDPKNFERFQVEYTYMMGTWAPAKRRCNTDRKPGQGLPGIPYKYYKPSLHAILQICTTNGKVSARWGYNKQKLKLPWMGAWNTMKVTTTATHVTVSFSNGQKMTFPRCHKNKKGGVGFGSETSIAAFGDIKYKPLD